MARLSREIQYHDQPGEDPGLERQQVQPGGQQRQEWIREAFDALARVVHQPHAVRQVSSKPHADHHVVVDQRIQRAVHTTDPEVDNGDDVVHHEADCQCDEQCLAAPEYPRRDRRGHPLASVAPIAAASASN